MKKVTIPDKSASALAEKSWHTLTVEKVCEELSVDPEAGLSKVEAAKRLARFGPNALREAKADGVFVTFLKQFQSPLVYLLGIAALVLFGLQEFIDAGLITFVLIFNAVVGTIQVGRAQDALAALKKFSDTDATVLRSGQSLIIPAKEVVPGDIIIIQEGEKVPADVRLIDEHNLRIDESALTGESEPVSKHAKAIAGENIPNVERKNLLFKGTTVVGGNARALVVATGINTVIGKVSEQIVEIDTEIPLQTNIRHLTHAIIYVVLIISISIFALGFLVEHHDMLEMLKLSVAIVISAIPEGLPIVITLLLATGVWRMSKRNVLVKRLQAVEALGEAKVIAVDKTGTVTKNELVVQQAYVDGKLFSISGVGYEAVGEISLDGQAVSSEKHKPLFKLAELAAFTADAEIVEQADGSHKVTGDPTEAALSIFAKKVGLERAQVLAKSPRLAEIPFDTQLKFHASLHKSAGRSSLAVAGAPEILLERADSILEGGKVKKLSDKRRHELVELFQRLSSDGLRVLALAYKSHRGKEVKPEEVEGLTLVGLVAMRDALRSEVHDAMDRAKSAGVRVVMITGDHQETARAIAREAGIYNEGDRVLTGAELETMGDNELREALKDTTVFARVTPEHKLRIVQGYRLRGEIVAMTGDGVNDALSLVAADLGVAMGINGTEVAKEASDLVLMDDNFGSIVSAIEEGRNIYQNIKKVLLYLFSTSVGEIIFIIIALISGYPLPILAAQIIWLNLVTDGLLDVALVMEPKEKTLLTRRFTRPGRYFFDYWMFSRLVLMSSMMALVSFALFAYFYHFDSYEKALSIALTVMAAFQWKKAWNCRSETQSVFLMGVYVNKYLFWATLIIVSLHIFAMNNPFMNKILGVVPLSFGEWMLCIAAAFSTIVIDELSKFIRRRIDAREAARRRVVTASSQS